MIPRNKLNNFCEINKLEHTLDDKVKLPVLRTHFFVQLTSSYYFRQSKVTEHVASQVSPDV